MLSDDGVVGRRSYQMMELWDVEAIRRWSCGT
jgi:hypothetical protein